MGKNQTPKPSEEENKEKADHKDKIPYGREAVKKAILDATENLLIKRNPSEITVREIAKVAKIKHPLIYRHFDTKEEVILAVHARSIGKTKRLISKIENLEGNVGLFFQAIRRNKVRQIALARAMIDGVDPHLIQNQFPVMQHFGELLKKRKDQTDSEAEIEFQVKIEAAVLSATALGWILYEPFLLAATGLEEKNKDQVEQKVIAFLEEIIQKLC